MLGIVLSEGQIVRPGGVIDGEGAGRNTGIDLRRCR